MRQHPLDLGGDQRLLGLADDRALAVGVEVLGQLLGDGGATLLQRAVADVGPEGPGDAPPVDAGVLVEAAWSSEAMTAIFIVVGDLVGGDDLPRRRLPELADRGAVDGVDDADLGVGLRLLVWAARPAAA